jgi:hypothetical protein
VARPQSGCLGHCVIPAQAGIHFDLFNKFLFILIFRFNASARPRSGRLRRCVIPAKAGIQ